jgi:hypothetical protein
MHGSPNVRLKKEGEKDNETDRYANLSWLENCWT